LQDVLADGPMQKREISPLAKSEGIADRTLTRAAKSLGVVSERDGTARGRPAIWRLADYSPTDPRTKSLAHIQQAADQEQPSPESGYAPSRRSGTKHATDESDGEAEWDL